MFESTVIDVQCDRFELNIFKKKRPYGTSGIEVQEWKETENFSFLIRVTTGWFPRIALIAPPNIQPYPAWNDDTVSANFLRDLLGHTGPGIITGPIQSFAVRFFGNNQNAYQYTRSHLLNSRFSIRNFPKQDNDKTVYCHGL